MIIKKINIYSIDYLKNELRSLPLIINERAAVEYEWIKKIDHYSKFNNLERTRKYVERNYGVQKMIYDFFDTRINILCSYLERLDDKELMFIYDTLIYPIKIKDVVKKYNLDNESHCYRKIDNILKGIIKRYSYESS